MKTVAYLMEKVRKVRIESGKLPTLINRDRQMDRQTKEIIIIILLPYCYY